MDPRRDDRFPSVRRGARPPSGGRESGISGAGGDEAYFGRDASKVIPQYLPDNVIGDRPRRLEAPRRKE